MGTTDLIFRVLALEEATKTFEKVSLGAARMAGSVEESNARMGLSAEERAAKEKAAAESGMKPMMGVSAPMLGVAAAAVVIGAKTVEMASKFEASAATLQTGAGEMSKNMGMVKNGMLDLAVQTGTSTEHLVSGMFMIESAGFHGADGLKVLTAAAKGAKVGHAELGTEANALTDILNDYHMPASRAAQATNMLTATVASGKTNMEELGASMSAVVPLASSAHVGFDQVAGAMATMTGHGMSAQQASQNLANTIRSLQAPNAVAVKEMQNLGLSATDVSMNLGKKGLTGTLDELTGAITSHMGPAGTVLMSAFNASKEASKNAQTEIATMPPSLQKVAEAYLHGSMTSKAWKTDLQGLDPIQKHLMQQFALTAKGTHSFNSMLTGGGPAAQTYNAALEKMTGGATGLNTSLMLTGENSATFAANVKHIGEAGRTTGDQITGWSTVTDTLSFKMDQAKQVVETTGIKIGTALLPAVKDLVGGFTLVAAGAGTVVGWLTHHKTVAEALGIGIAAVLLPSLWGVVTAMGAAAVETAIAAAPFVAVIAVVAALAWGFMELVHHWGTVEHAFVQGFDFVKDHWKIFVAALLPGVGMIIVGVTELVTHWKQVQHFLGDIWHDTEAVFEAVFVDPALAAVHFLDRGFTSGVGFFNRIFTKDIPAWFHDGEHALEAVFVTPAVNALHLLDRGFTAGVSFFERIFTRDIPGWLATGAHLFTAIFITPVVNAVHWLETGFQNSFGAIKGFVSAAFQDVIGIVRGPVDGVIGLVDQAIGYLDGLHVSIPSWVPLIGGDSFGVSIPQIPMLAGGGLVMPKAGGTTVTVAEAGAPEIVTPIPAMQAAMTAALTTAGGSHASAGAPGSSPGNPLYAVLDLRLNGEHIDRILVKFLKSGGTLQSVKMAVA
ncbi:phage tail tape measure protein [Streptacidiphilus sp. EB103A]|uniref:phage tail tape measure protein n=1 Tax=Streptacidiphilus sp. EB103A TaxID=3156275 RepID=UPI003516BB5E